MCFPILINNSVSFEINNLDKTTIIIRMYDTLGKLCKVIEKPSSDTKKQIVIVNTKELPRGNYFYEIEFYGHSFDGVITKTF